MKRVYCHLIFGLLIVHSMSITGADTQRSLSDFGGSIVASMASAVLVSASLYVIDKVLISRFQGSTASVNEKDFLNFNDYGGPIPQQVRYFIETYKDKNFMRLGAQRQKGILLYGPPGTGKTLLAKVIAGEIGAGFYPINAAEVESMYVGSGPERLRTIFHRALSHARKHNTTSVIFIDEIDIISAKEDKAMHQSSRQTLTQLLTLMDGFEKDTPVVFIAATNRIDVMDPAVLREGRFDEKIAVDLPGCKTRRAIIGVIAQRYVLGYDVDLDDIALRTEGFSGAELKNAFNRAALDATFNKEDAVWQEYIDRSLEQNPKYFNGTLVSRSYGL